MPAGGNRLRAPVLILIFVVLSLGPGVLGQFPGPRTPPPPPDFDLITSYVTVTASKGAAPRLSANDFQIFEDNQEQKIDYFAVQNQPATVGILWGAGTDAEPDVRECPRDFMKNMVPGSEYFVLSSDIVT